MAKFELKFIDLFKEKDFIKCESYNQFDVEDKVIKIEGYVDSQYFHIFLDKSTAIKFAKTLRTEINKITESEGLDG